MVTTHRKGGLEILYNPILIRDKGYNPILPENWAPEPKTHDDFEIWMEATKMALLEWLKAK